MAGIVALLLTILLGLRTFGLFERPSYLIRAQYIPERDVLGFQTMPHFIIEMDNTGNVPVTFTEFEIVLPRLDVIREGEFVGSLGADLFIDKQRASRIGGIQEFAALDYRTTKVDLAPRRSQTEFFDLSTLVPEGYGERIKAGIPHNFEPVVQFHDNYGNYFHCDRRGVHRGPYEHPDAQALTELGYKRNPPEELSSRRTFDWRRLRRTWT